jgi:hypothetical protein
MRTVAMIGTAVVMAIGVPVGSTPATVVAAPLIAARAFNDPAGDIGNRADILKVTVVTTATRVTVTTKHRELYSADSEYPGFLAFAYWIDIGKSHAGPDYLLAGYPEYVVCKATSRWRAVNGCGLDSSLPCKTSISLNAAANTQTMWMSRKCFTGYKGRVRVSVAMNGETLTGSQSATDYAPSRHTFYRWVG